MCDLVRLPSGAYSLVLQRTNHVCVVGTFDASVFVISVPHRAVMQRLACHSDIIWSLSLTRAHHRDEPQALSLDPRGKTIRRSKRQVDIRAQHVLDE